MPTPSLRDPLFTSDNTPSAAVTQAVENLGKSTLRRGFEAGRIGTDINSLGAQEASLLASGDPNDAAKAVDLRSQIESLQQRQAGVAPEVGSYKQVDGLGTGADYVAGTVGQMGASMVDPIVGGAAIGAAGRLAGLSKNPIAQILSKIAPYAAPAAAGVINQRQLKGEFYNDAVQDPALMASKTPQEINRMAEIYGGLAAIPDTALPGIVGSQLVGRGGLKALGKMGAGKILAESAGEGLGEVAQEKGKQIGLGMLNPNRDTSGDRDALIDSALGGFIGGAGPATIGHYAEAAHNRVSGSEGRMSTNPGDQVDLGGSGGSEQPQGGPKPGRGWFNWFRAGQGSPEDLGGPVGAQAEPAAKSGTNPAFKVSPEDQAALRAEPPAGMELGSPKANDWFAQSDEARAPLVLKHLGALAAQGDETAAQLAQAMHQAPDYSAQMAAADEGAAHILQAHDLHDLNAKGQRQDEALKILGNAAGSLGAKAVKGTAKAVGTLAKAAWDGATSKKNAQTANDGAQRADLATQFAGDMAAKRHAGLPGVQSLAKHMVRELAGMGQGFSTDRAASAPRGDALGNREAKLNRIAGVIQKTYREQAGDVLAQLGQILGPEHKKNLAYVAKEVQALSEPSGVAHARAQRNALADQLVALVPLAKQKEMLAEGINIRDGKDRDHFVKVMEDLADGAAPRDARSRLYKLFSKDAVHAMLDVLNGHAQEKEQNESSMLAKDDSEVADADRQHSVDDDGEATDNIKASDFDARAGEKALANASAPKVFGYGLAPKMRTGKPFAREGQGADAKRPVLLKKTDTLSDGRNALDAKVESVKRQLKVDTTPARMAKLLRQEGKPVRAESIEKAAEQAKTDPKTAARLKEETEAFFTNRAGEWDVQARPALDVMHEHGMQPGEMLAVYRDYLRQAASDQKLTEEERQAAGLKARTVSKAVIDVTKGATAPVLTRTNGSDMMTDEQQKGSGIRTTKQGQGAFQLSAGDRRQVYQDAVQFLSEHHLVVGEQLSDRAPETFTAPEVMALAKRAAKALDAARLGDDQNASVSEANVITFKAVAPDESHKSEALGDKQGNLHIKANDLANWGRKQREQSEASDLESNKRDFSKRSADEQYIADLGTGIAALMASGLVEQSMPTKLNAAGKVETFDKGIPPSLQLPTMAAGEREYGNTQRAAKAKPGEELVPGSDEHQEAVALEQTKEIAPLDTDSIKQDPSTANVRTEQALTSAERAELSKFPTLKERMAYIASLKVDATLTGTHGAQFNPDARAEDARTNRTDRTPSEFAKQDKRAAPDDYADQRWQSRAEGMDASNGDVRLGLERKAYNSTDAANRANLLVRTLKDDFAEGLAQLQRRLNTALRGTDPNADPNGLTGGIQYVFPAAHALSAEAVSNLDLSPAEATQVAALRAKAADIILGSKLPDGTKISLTRAMESKAPTDRTTNLGNYKAALKEISQEAKQAAPEVAAQEAPKPQSAPDGVRNAQAAAEAVTTSTPEQRQAAIDYVRKVLGPKVTVSFEDITGYSGEWLDHDQVMKISTTAAAGAMGTAYHEALHGFFSNLVKNDPKALKALKALAENPKLLARLQALLAKYPSALKQLHDGEERLAYAFQFWAAGQLDLPHSPARTAMQKLRKFFRQVTGMVTDSERAVDLLQAFHDGKLADPSYAGKAMADILAQGTMTPALLRRFDKLAMKVVALTAPSETILANSESAAARELAHDLFSNPSDEGAGNRAEGYINARARMSKVFNNAMARTVNGLSQRDMVDVARYMQNETEPVDIPYAPHREAVKELRAQLDKFYKYMTDEKGMDVKRAGDKYFPVVWSPTVLSDKRDDFIKMLTTNYPEVMQAGVTAAGGKLTGEDVAARIWQSIMDRNGVQDSKLDVKRDDGVLAPFFANAEHRELGWIEAKDREPFLDKGLVGTLSRYFHQGVHAAEYTSRFGANGERLAERLQQVHNELIEAALGKVREGTLTKEQQGQWIESRMKNARSAVGAMEGSLGNDVSPALRKFNSWMMVYQNLRLLPLSLFGSFVDPLGMVVRGATMSEAYDTFMRGMKEVVRNWGDMFREEPKAREDDKWTALAEHIGALDASLFSHHVSEEFSSAFMARGAKKVNDALFKINGMEAWNRGMRAGATRSAVMFIERHAKLPDKNHSERWLSELGLASRGIPLDSEGHLITDADTLAQVKGLDPYQAKRDMEVIHRAINRWAEGAILTPNAAHRPSWGSDPHYSMFFHLKQFSYSFQQTILKRAMNEVNHGNMGPMGAFLPYIPVMIAADITKGLLVGGGSLPAHMQGMNLGDWVAHGMERSGLLGAGALGVDAAHDVFSLAGPGVEQVTDAFSTPIGKTINDSLPLHGLWQGLLK